MKIILAEFNKCLYNKVDLLESIYYKYKDLKYPELAPMVEYDELPGWIAQLTYKLKQVIPEELLKHEVINSNNPYKYIESKTIYIFSNYNATSKLLKDFANDTNENAIVLYGGIEIKNNTNEKLRYFKTFDDLIEEISNIYKVSNINTIDGLDYTLLNEYKNCNIIPRIGIVDGCIHNCSFCTVDKTIKFHKFTIEEQLHALRDFEYNSIYINDKTFGMHDKQFNTIEKFNYILADTYKIVQTRVDTFLQNLDEFIRIPKLYVELGIETFNDEILDVYNKRITIYDILSALTLAKQNNIKIIVNLIVDHPLENKETYKNTYNMLVNHIDTIAAVNFYTYTDYNKGESETRDLINEDSKIFKNDVYRLFINKYKNSLK